MMWWYGNGNGIDGWGYALMTVSMVLFWGLVIFAVIAFVRTTSRGDQSVTAARPTAEQLLAERFARGDINEEEFTRRRQLLHSTSAQSS